MSDLHDDFVIAKRKLRDWGLDTSEASIVANHLRRATEVGHESHGLDILPLITSAPYWRPESPEIVTQSPIPKLIGNRNLGYICGELAIQYLCKEGARKGFGLIGLTNMAPSLGCLGNYAEVAVRNGLAFIGCSVSPPAMSGNSAKASFGTNPWCIGVSSPDGRHLIIDAACSVVSWGAARKHMSSVGHLPPHWGNANNAGEILLQPMGGFKGVLLAAFVEAAVGMMCEAPTRADVEWSAVWSVLDISGMLEASPSSFLDDLFSALESESETGRLPGSSRFSDI